MSIRILFAAALAPVLLPAQCERHSSPASPAGTCTHGHHGAAAAPGACDAIAPAHAAMLARLAAGSPGAPLACCFTGDVPWQTIAAFEAALNPERFATRWTYSATNAGPLWLGDPIVLTYSFIPDGTMVPGAAGEPQAASNMFAVLDSIQGAGTWQTRIHQVFNRWSAQCGITFRHEPNDDGAAFPSTPGVVGVRGDLRIGGHYIDGQTGGNVLAYAHYPHTGDIVLDTSNTVFFGDPNGNALAFRNTIGHEVGHAIGAAHVCPIDQTKLMEPWLTTAFDGPQHDEVRGAQGHYGDRHENNDTAASATPLGSLTGGTSVSNVSIDGPADADWYAFTIDAAKQVTLRVIPVGSTYLEGPNATGCTGVATLNTLAANDLGIELYGDGGATLLGRVDAVPAGGSELLERTLWSAPGDYRVRVFGALAGAVQLYTLVISPTEMPKVLRTFAGASSADEFGASIAGLGDLDGDGYGELLVGAPGNRDPGVATGMVRLFDGRTRSAVRTWYGVGGGDEFGRAVAGVGDIDRDGTRDFAVGAPGDDAAGPDQGSVRLYSGRTGALLTSGFGVVPGERFGAAVAGIGDVTLDGIPDLAVGAPGSGSVRLLSGSGGLLATLSGGSAGSRFGTAVAAGDVNRDGFQDVIVGAPDDAAAGSASGSAYVYSFVLGTVTQLFAFRGAAADENFGIAVDCAGDVNRDQYADVIVGARLDSRSPRRSGYAEVYSGRDGRELRRLEGDQPDDQFGTAVARLGDVDEDQYADFAVAARSTGSGQLGYVQVVSGRGNVLATIPGQYANGGFGVLADTGDVDGDGWLDVAVGAPQGGAAGQGVVTVFSTSVELRPGSNPIGSGCGAGAVAPTLASDPPELGRTVHAMIGNATPSRAGSIFVSNVGAVPLAMSASCRIYLDLPSTGQLATFFTSSGGQSGASIRLPPPTPEMIGMQVMIQAAVLPTAAPLGFDLTNAVIWTLR